MALISCHECGKEISNSAEKCPHCGAPPKKGTSIVKIAFLSIAMFTMLSMLLSSIFSGGEASKQTTEKLAAPAFATDEATQEKRKTLLQKLIAQGVFYKIEVPSELPHAYVDRNWYSAAIDDKKAFAGVVYTYYATIRGGPIRLNNHTRSDKWIPAIGFTRPWAGAAC